MHRSGSRTSQNQILGADAARRRDITMSITETPTLVVADAAAGTDKSSYVDWPAIIGGAALAALEAKSGGSSRKV